MFYLTTIKDDSQGVLSYDTLDAAKSAFHGELKYGIDAGISTCCYITDRHGKVLKRDEHIHSALSMSEESEEAEN